MDKNLFLKNMEEMIQIAKTNGNQIDHKELLDYFSDYELNEEAKKLLIASFVEAGIRVLGVDEAQIVAEEEAKEKADISEEEQGAIRFYEEELEQMDLPGEEEQKELIHAWLVEKGDGEAVIESFLPQILEIARTHKVDFILAVGGGSVVDYAKALSVSIHCEEDPWEKYYARFEEPVCEIVPVGVVLTMVGTGSEMNTGAVITYPEKKLKIGHVFTDERIMPKFSILNPRYTMSLPKNQMIAGIYDIFNHICEQYFSGEDDNTSDYISEGLIKSVIHSSRIAIKDKNDYEARSNLMWSATWALNTLVSRGKSTDWMVHMIGQSVGACSNATHGMTLSAVSLPYYKMIMPYGVRKFARFAVNVWDISPDGKNEEELAKEGLSAMEAWMKELGLAMKLSEIGVTMEMIDDIVNGTLIMEGGYKVLSKEDVRKVLMQSM